MSLSEALVYAPKPAGVAGHTFRHTVPSYNKSTFKPGETIMLNIPTGRKGQFLNTKMSYLQFRIANTTATRNSITQTDNAYLAAYRAWVAGGQVGPAPLRGSSTISKGNNVDLGVIAGGLLSSNPATMAFTILNAGYALDIELSAMQEEGRGEVISSPRVVTSNQREAVIKQGREIGYVTTQSSGGQITQTVNFKDVVLELKVTPTITNDGRVFMNMLITKDELEEFVQTINGSVPIISGAM